MKKRKMNFLLKALIYLAVLAVLFVIAIWGTKYYFYDSDFSVKKTDLSNVSVDGIKIGMNISDIDVSKYTQTDNVVDDCDYNFEELSFKTDSKGNITYIFANYRKVDLLYGQEDTVTKAMKVNEIWNVLGENYKTDMYKPDENNYRKISKYSDTDNDVYLGIVYSRYNNELLNIIVSKNRLKD